MRAAPTRRQEWNMSKLGSLTDLQERLAITERAVADATARLGELTGALADITQASGIGDIAKAKPIVIGADTVTPFCIGFYQREYDAADRPYRWTGRGNLFELRFAVDRSFEWNFAMELQSNTHVDISRLRAYADYLEIETQVDPLGAIVRGIIPARPLGRQVVMTFQQPDLFVPNQINPESTDARTLGVVFYEFRAIPTLLDNAGEDAVLPVRTSATAAPPSKSVSADAGNESFLRKARSSLSAGVARAKSR
jgi:hypothetical protein